MLLKGIFSPGLVSGRGIWKRRREKKSQVDVIDRGGDFVYVCVQWGLNCAKCAFTRVCTNSCVSRLFCIYLAAQVSSSVGTGTLCPHL